MTFLTSKGEGKADIDMFYVGNGNIMEAIEHL